MPDYIPSGIVIPEWFNRIADRFNRHAPAIVACRNDSFVIINNDYNSAITDVRLNKMYYMYYASDWSIRQRTPFILVKPDNYTDETSADSATIVSESSFTFRGIKIRCHECSNGNEWYQLYDNISINFLNRIAKMIPESDHNMSPIFIGKSIKSSFRDHMLNVADHFYMPTKYNQMMFTLHQAACLAAFSNNRLPTRDDFKGLEFKDKIVLSEMKIGLNPLFKDGILGSLDVYGVTAEWVEEVTAPYANVTIPDNNITTQ